jgi:hypothetical protein
LYIRSAGSLLDKTAKELLAKETFSTEDLKRIAAELSPIGQRQAAPGTNIGIAAMTAIRP